MQADTFVLKIVAKPLQRMTQLLLIVYRNLPALYPKMPLTVYRLFTVDYKTIQTSGHMAWTTDIWITPHH